MSGSDESDVPGRALFFLDLDLCPCPSPESEGLRRNAGADGLRGAALGEGGAFELVLAERLFDDEVGARVW